ncbi:hypothetical protein [Cellulomonas carbonis]|uniref:hypothetical protein n=1 Tax=Cellulomonas carbonis TaxID=1386092 RepID=UPI000B0D86B4|nr:hypothetical protein [Cellulomonas carbonis]
MRDDGVPEEVVTMVQLHDPVRFEDLSRMLLGEPAPTCSMCMTDEHEGCPSADELGAADLCGCACHLW